MGLFGKPKTVEIDYDKLADAIVKAHDRIKLQEQIEQDNEQKQSNDQWNSIIHYKNYPETRNIFLRGVWEFRNLITVLFSIVFFKKKYANDDVVTFGLMRLALSSLFRIIKWLLYAVFLIMLFGIFYSLERKEWITQPIYILYSFGALLFARLFRVAEFEAENMHDRQNLIGILSALSAFLALIVAIISLVVAVVK